MKLTALVWLAVVMGCGGGGGTPTDAPLDPDAAPDAAVVDAPPDDGGHHHPDAPNPDAPLPDAAPEPQTPYEVTPPSVDATTTSVAVIPRPPRVDVSAPTNCPHLDATLQAWNPAWLAQDGTITIPVGVRTLVRGNDDLPTTLVRKLVVPSTSELVFDDRPTTLSVTDIEVSGTLRMGSATCRIQSQIVVELDTDEDVANPSVRDAIYQRAGLGVVVHQGGVLEIFGKLYQPTWTRLAATAAYTDTVTLAEPVDWEVGQQIVVATGSTIDYPSSNQNEVRTIAEVVNPTTLRLASYLSYAHYTGPEYALEVGLLSRKIVFRTSTRVRQAAPTFGGHLMSHARDIRVSGAELYQLGQLNQLGRYPFHLHQLGDVDGRAALTDSSVWQSNWRCAVVHRTDRAVISRNVAFDVWGHCFYLEDGVEMNNELSFNLAVRPKLLGPTDSTAMNTMKSDGQEGFTLVQSETYRNPADRAAAGFYLPNGNNRVIGNAASGGFAGFAFPNLPHAIGGSDAGILPIRYSASHFDGNTAHSAGHLWTEGGACIYFGGVLTEVDDGGVTKLQYRSGRSTAWEHLRHTPDVLNNTKTFLCQSGVVHWGSRPRMVSSEGADNMLLAKLFGSASIQGAVVHAKTANTASYWPINRGFQFYDTDTQTILRDVVFRGFQPKQPADPINSWDNCALFSMNHSNEWTPQRMNAVSRIFFANTPDSQRLCHDDTGTLASRNFNLVDADGSLTGLPGDTFGAPRLVGSAFTDTWKIGPACVKNAAWGVWVCPLAGSQHVASISTTPNANVRVTMYGLGGTSLGENWYSASEFIDAQITGPSEVGWHHAFPNGVPPTIDVRALQVPDGSYALLSFTLPTGVACSIPGWTAAPDLAGLLAATGAAYTTDRGTCFVRIPPTGVGDFTAAGLSIPNQTWRSDVAPAANFTISTGCSAAVPACATIVSTLPTLP